MLYWAVFTLGFMAGAMLSFRIFAAKDPEEEVRPKLVNREPRALNELLFEPIKAPLKLLSSAFSNKG